MLVISGPLAYVAFGAMLIVLFALSYLLVYAALAARAALRLMVFMEEEGRKMGELFGRGRRMFRLAYELFLH